MGQKFPHFTNDFILSLDKTVVVRVGQLGDSAVWNLFAKAFDLLLLKLRKSAQKFFRLGSGRIGQSLNNVRRLGTGPDCGDAKGW
jgi:hypothetical protein